MKTKRQLAGRKRTNAVIRLWQKLVPAGQKSARPRRYQIRDLVPW